MSSHPTSLSLHSMVYHFNSFSCYCTLIFNTPPFFYSLCLFGKTLTLVSSTLHPHHWPWLEEGTQSSGLEVLALTSSGPELLAGSHGLIHSPTGIFSTFFLFSPPLPPPPPPSFLALPPAYDLASCCTEEKQPWTEHFLKLPPLQLPDTCISVPVLSLLSCPWGKTAMQRPTLAWTSSSLTFSRTSPQKLPPLLPGQCFLLSWVISLSILAYCPRFSAPSYSQTPRMSCLFSLPTVPLPS